MTLLYFAIAWIAGVAVATLSPTLAPIWLVLAVGGLIVAVLTRRDITGRRIGLCMVIAGLGMWRLASAQPGHFTSDDLATYNDTGFARLTGIIVDIPSVQDTTIHLRVDVQTLQRDQQDAQPVHGLALVYADRSGHYAYGDKVEISGNPSTPPTFDTFSYQDYLARSDVYTLVSCYPAGCPLVRVMEHGQGNPLLATMFDIKTRSRQLISQLLPNPQSGLLTGILLGDNTQIPAETSMDFSQTGTTHLIAISGSNITIIAGLLFAIFGHLGNKRVAAVAMIIGIIVYTIFTGASASTVRAAIMAVLVILAERFGRRSDGLTALAASVWVMTILNPLLLFDIGLVLSSAATLGLILYTEPLTRWAEGIISRLFHSDTAKKVVDIFSDSVLITVAAQVTTLPVIALVFGQFSLISFPVNILVVPAQGMIMSLGILAIVMGAIWLPAGQIVAWLAAVPLTYTLGIIHAMAHSFGPSQPVIVSPVAFALYYIVLFGLTAVYSQPPEKRGQLIQWMKRVVSAPAVILLGVAVAGLIWAVVISRPDGKLHVWFLSVGKGNAVLIQTPHGAHILVDGGENATQLSGAIGNRLPFYQHDLDAMFITQHKPETITALPPLLDRYMPKLVISNGQVLNNDLYATLADALMRTGTQTIPAWAGYQLHTDDGVTIAVLNPQQEVIPKADNPKPDDPPLVLRLSYGNASFLLTSELSQDDIKTLTGLPQSVVLELPSNGAEKINTPDWLQSINPQVAVVEAEQGNPNAQPAPSVLKSLDTIPVYRTDDQGTVEIASDGNQLWISPDRAGR